MAISQSRLVKAMAEIETTYGTAPTYTPASDGFLLISDGSPVAVDTNTVDISPLQSSFTKSKDLIGRQLYIWSGTVFLQNEGASTYSPRYNDLLRACAMQEATAASSVTYTPRTTGLESVALATDLDGIKHELKGAYGTFSMSGSAGQGIEVGFNMSGLYNAPSTTAPSFSGHAAGSNLAETMKSVALSINNGTSTWASSGSDPLAFKSFSFDRGVTVGERSDANASDALAGLSIEDSAPTLQVVVEAKTQFGANNVIDFWTDLTGSVTHNVSFTHGSAVGKKIQFDFPQAQLTDVSVGDGEAGTRSWTLDYKLTHTSADSEFTLTWK